MVERVEHFLCRPLSEVLWLVLHHVGVFEFINIAFKCMEWNALCQDVFSNSEGI